MSAKNILPLATHQREYGEKLAAYLKDRPKTLVSVPVAADYLGVCRFTLYRHLPVLQQEYPILLVPRKGLLYSAS